MAHFYIVHHLKKFNENYKTFEMNGYENSTYQLFQNAAKEMHRKLKP